jgi:hypothetical protein
MRFWINTVSRDHVRLGVEGGFTQANHGRPTTLRRLARGELLVFYSPRTSLQGGEPLQRFTAIGRITDDEVYQAEMTPTFRPWRRRVDFIASEEVSITDLIGELGFNGDKQRWGFPFRRGLFEIGEEDFRSIAAAMKATI